MNPTSVCFKKKTKCNQDIAKSLEEINECKNDIYHLQGQISHRGNNLPVSAVDISDLESEEEDEIQVREK